MIALVLGGTRSGKSAVAEAWIERLADGACVTYVATAIVDPFDNDHAARVAAHQLRRPAHWVTVDPHSDRSLPQVLLEVDGAVLLDSLGTWVAAHHDGRDDFAVDEAPLLDALAARRGDTIIVSEEVGMSVHPPTVLGRRYADALGTLNHGVAAMADRVVLVVAGQVLPLSSEPPQ